MRGSESRCAAGAPLFKRPAMEQVAMGKAGWDQAPCMTTEPLRPARMGHALQKRTVNSA